MFCRESAILLQSPYCYYHSVRKFKSRTLCLIEGSKRISSTTQQLKWTRPDLEITGDWRDCHAVTTRFSGALASGSRYHGSRRSPDGYSRALSVELRSSDRPRSREDSDNLEEAPPRGSSGELNSQAPVGAPLGRCSGRFSGRSCRHFNKSLAHSHGASKCDATLNKMSFTDPQRLGSLLGKQAD